MVKFGYTICYVANVREAITFYENAFQMERKFVTPEGDYGELSTGDTTLAFASLELGQNNLPNGFIGVHTTDLPIGIEIALVTEQVEEAMEQGISNGATEVKAVETKPWGQSVGYLRCPSGVLLEICSPIQG